MRFEIVERDFVFRTLALLNQYDQYVLPRVPDSEQFEVTLLLNSLLGLIVLPVGHSSRVQDADMPTPFRDDQLTIPQAGSQRGLSRLRVEKFRLRGGFSARGPDHLKAVARHV